MIANTMISQDHVSIIASCGEWEDVIALLEELRNSKVDPDISCHTEAIRSLERVGQWEQALKVLDEAVAHTLRRSNSVGHNDRFASRTLSSDGGYQAAVRACAHGRRWDTALSLLDEMLEQGYQPDSSTHSAALAACGHRGQWAQAMRLLSLQSRGAPSQAGASSSGGGSPSKLEGRWERALELLKTADNAALGSPRSMHPDHKREHRLQARDADIGGLCAAAAAVTACARGGRVELAARLLNEFPALVKGMELDQQLGSPALLVEGDEPSWRQ